MKSLVLKMFTLLAMILVLRSIGLSYQTPKTTKLNQPEKKVETTQNTSFEKLRAFPKIALRK